MEEKKKSKKWIVVLIVLIILLAIGGIVGYLLYQHMQEEETTDTDWGDIYYEYLKEARDAEDMDEFGFEKGAKKQKIRFLESDDSDNPNMVVDYEKDGEDRVSIFFVIEEKVEYYNPEKESEVKLLYNIENEEYDWYLLTEDNNTEELTSIKEIKKGNIDAEYVFDTEDEREEQFVEVETEDEGIELDELEERSDLKKAIKDAVKEFKTVDDILTKDVKEEVEEKVEKIIENKKESINTNESSEFIQTGNYTLKYGKYIGYNYVETADPDSRYDIVIELTSDGLYKEVDTFSDGKEETYKGRYSIVDGSKYGMTGKLLEFNNDRGIFQITKNNEFSYVAGAGSVFKYEEEKTTDSDNKLVIKTLTGVSKITETDEGIQFGDRLVKYGRYENKYIASQINEPEAYSILTIKPNGEFHLKANVDDSGNMITPIDEDGTFYIEENLEEYPGTYSDFINFKTESGMKFSLYSILSNQWTGYEYVGE